MSTPKTIFVKASSSNGNGSFQFPFSSINDAIEFANKDSVIYMIDASFDVSGPITFNNVEGVTICPYTSEVVAINNTGLISITNSCVKFSNVKITPQPTADNIIYAENSRVSLLEVEVGSVNVSSPSVTASSFYLTNSTMTVTNSTFDFSSNLEPGVLSSIFTVKNNSYLTMTGTKVKNIQKDMTFISQYDEKTSVSVMSCDIGPGALSNSRIGASSFISFYGKSSAMPSRLDLIGNKFSGVPRAIHITNDPVIANKGCQANFKSSVFGADYFTIVAMKNYFDTCRCVYHSDIQAAVTFYNNTINNGNFAFVARNRATINMANSIITNLQMLPEAARPESTLKIEYPYDYSTFNISGDSTAAISYSCLYNNYGIAVPDGVVKGPVVRYLDPIYVDAMSGDLRLSPNSPLVDSGMAIGAPYIGSSIDIGAYEGKRFSSDSDFVAYLKRKSNIDLVTNIASNIDFVAYAKDKLKELFPQLNLSPGSPIIDLLVKPFAIMANPLQKEIEGLFMKMSIANYASMSEVDFDELAANFFVSRQYGGLASGTIRIYLFTAENIEIPAGTVFYTSDNIRFEAKVDFVYSALEVMMNKEESSGFYYVDVLVEAVEFGSLYNVDRETVGSSELVHDFIAKISNPYRMSGGSSSETNKDLYDRIRKAVTVRNLINKPSIDTVLHENFSSLDYAVPIGFRDPEMSRDTLYPFASHFGGCTDIYISTHNITDSEVILQVLSDGNGPYLNINSSIIRELPILWITSISLIDLITGNVVNEISKSDYAAVIVNKDLRYSNKESMQIRFADQNLANKKVKIAYKSCQLVGEINDFVNNPKQRVVLGDYLVKHFYPIKVDVSLRCKNNSSQSNIKYSISDFIYSIKNGGTLSKSELLSAISSITGFVADATVITLSMYSPDSSDPTVIKMSDSQTVSNLSKFIPGDITILPLQ